MMRLTYLGHSGFVAQLRDDVVIVFDYYTDECEVLSSILEKARLICVLVSHSHPDHFNQEILRWHERFNYVWLILANDCRHKIKHYVRQHPQLPVSFMHLNEDFELNGIAIHSFNSTDVGLCYLVRVGDYLLFHAGDFNNWHFSDSAPAKQVNKAQGDFRAILRTIIDYVGDRVIDVAMFPVDPRIGHDFERGATEFVEAIQVRHFIPMHMWELDDEVLATGLITHRSIGHFHHMAPGETLII